MTPQHRHTRQTNEPIGRAPSIDASLTALNHQFLLCSDLDMLEHCLHEWFRLFQEIVGVSTASPFSITVINESHSTAQDWVYQVDENQLVARPAPWKEVTSRASYDLFMDTPLHHRQENLFRNQGIEASAYTYVILLVSGWIQFGTTAPLEASKTPFLQQFTRLADQFQIRYADLKKISQLTKGTLLEAALQRVRNRTISMDRSEELSEVASLMFHNLAGLFDFSAQFTRLVIVLTDEAAEMNQVWTTNFTGQSMSAARMLPLTDHPAQKEMYLAWKRDKSGFHSIFFEGKDAYEYILYLVQLPGFDADHELKEIITLLEKDSPLIPKSFYLNMAFFSSGRVGMITIEQLADEHINILKQFAQVFEQTYTRFLDLKKAEQLAIESTQQSVLDRVRGEIASMRSSEDLNRITPLIWRELTTLNVPFFRCGLFIMNEQEQNIQSFLTSPSGEHLARLMIPYDSPEPTQSVLNSWRKRLIHSIFWDKKQFLDWSNAMVKGGLLESPSQLPMHDDPPEKMALYFIPFNQGMIYIGNLAPISEDHLQIVQSVADTFSVAYARYEDFQVMESNNIQLATTLSNLEKTQAQLIQSEKMASLGQLTTGIAHEIKNPLNFINNFSLLSIDMLEELEAWIQEHGGRHEKEIIQLIIANEKLIHQHGTRADNIVNSMTHHARKGSDERQTVLLSTILDEYITLVAQDGVDEKGVVCKPVITRHYDPDAEQVELFQQQFGQVIINLLNNALDAMREKKALDDTFVPTLTIATSKKNQEIEIRISDNGPGIPPEVTDKIFEPFFTTKPLGRGTGLGLYLSYDIITKGHGGDLYVESDPDIGTTFIISLPA